VEPPSGADAPFPRTPLRLSLPDLVIDLDSEVGLFSHRSIDVGTEVLLRYAPPPPNGRELLDLGCGYGAIALALAIRAPRSRVWAIDVDERAVDLTEENGRRAGLPNIIACTPRQVPPELRFRAIYSNPPIRIGKMALRSLLAHWLGRLDDDGTAYLVVKRNAGADGLSSWLNEAGFPTSRSTTKRDYVILRVTRAGDG
jgi:16S rRNA (guanine1207-N2)-methyltransferase